MSSVAILESHHICNNIGIGLDIYTFEWQVAEFKKEIDIYTLTIFYVQEI